MEDPSYVYLINSLNVSLRYDVGHFDHPGTTVQVIGAVTIRIYHWLSNRNADLIMDVLSRPEDYLSLMHTILILISSTTLFLLGLLTYKLSRNILLSLFIQLSPFVSIEVFYGYKIVSSDNFLITVSMGFLGILIYYLFKVKTDVKSPLIFVLIFAIISALGLATKLIFFPLIIIPLILITGYKNKIIFLFFVSVSFLIFVLPAISNYKQFFDWVWNLLIHTGSYGQGNSSVVDTERFSRALKLIFQKDIVFAVSYILSIATFVFTFFKSKNDAHLTGNQKKEKKILFSIIIATTIQIIFVAKHYGQHYMIPSFMLSMLSLSLCGMLLSSYFKRLKLRPAFLGIIIIIAVLSFFSIINTYNTYMMLRDEAYKAERFVKGKSSNALVISSFCSANKEFSLALGISNSGRKIKLYKTVLSQIQSQNIFYIHWFDELFSLTTKDNVRKILQENRKIIFQTNQEDKIGKFAEILKNIYDIKIVSQTLVFSNKINEKVYEITTESLNEEKK